jgi:hypothetical protein
LKYLPLLILSCLLASCASTQRQVIASSDNFIVIQTSDNDTYGSLAEEFLGSKKYSEVLERYNPETSITTGTFIAVPKRTINQSGVFVDGYQRVPILCYHQFTEDSESQNKMVVTRAEFESQW